MTGAVLLLIAEVFDLFFWCLNMAIFKYAPNISTLLACLAPIIVAVAALVFSISVKRRV